jgi:methylmalonyl-CoA/ethylmalonyl-CoA epimerase
MSVATEQPVLTRIRQIAINAKDLDGTVPFYRDVLGMKLLFRVPKMAFFDCAGIRLMLSEPERPEYDHPGSVLYYEVADITSAHDQLRGRGVAFEGEPHIVHRAEDYDLWMAFFRDPEGNTLALMQEKARS